MEQKSSSFSWLTECKRARFPEDLWLTFLCRSGHATSPRHDSLTLRSQVVRITVHWVFAVTFGGWPHGRRFYSWCVIGYKVVVVVVGGGLDVLHSTLYKI